MRTWHDLKFVATDLACERGGRLVFSRLNFTLPHGQILELRGPNGSGKSSLLRMLAGLLEPVSGTFALRNSAADIQDCFHFVGHNNALKSALTVAENLAFWSDLLGGKPNLSAFRLQNLANTKTQLLSEGQKRRLALSRLVSVPRPLWLLDEPTLGLDKTALSDLQNEMTNHLKLGGLIIAATHVALGLPKTKLLHIGGTL